jgi:sortase A
LKQIRVCDTIALTTEHGNFEYLVESITVVPPTDTGVIRPTSRRTLTLITCFPFTYIGPAPDRFIVRARDITAARR